MAPVPEWYLRFAVRETLIHFRSSFDCRRAQSEREIAES